MNRIYACAACLAVVQLAPLAPAQFVESDVRLIYSIDGEALGDSFGLELVAVGDYDGDGARELLISAPGNDQGANNAGKAYLLDGATGAVLREHAGSRVGEARRNVCDAGDVDGDGVLDYLIGTGDDWVYVHSGATGALLHALNGLPGEGYGFRSCGVGDLDGDGHGELLVGAPGNDAAALNAGRAYVISGVDGALLREHELAIPNSSLGHTVAALGDLDGDAVGDYAIGAPGPYTAAQPGQLLVISGASGLELLPRPKANSSGRIFGAWVPALGGADLDGDGVPEFTATDLGDQGNDTGRLYVYDGATRALRYDVPGFTIDGGFGGVPPNPASQLGDANGDGVGDLLVGSWESKLGAFNGGQADILSGVDGARLRSVTSSVAGAFLGGSAAGMGFVDSDGEPDFALGANGTAGTRGRVFVIAGRVSLGSNYCSVQANSTGAPARLSATGSASIAAGDLSLFAAPVPAELFLFFHGSTPIEAPFGDGFRCVGSSVARLLPAGLASGGLAWRAVDPSSEPGVVGTRHFQCWFRDPGGAGAGFNTSDGLSVTLHP